MRHRGNYENQRQNYQSGPLFDLGTIERCRPSVHGEPPSAKSITDVFVLRNTILGLVRRAGPDLSVRQLTVFLTCYLEDQVQTPGGLEAKLNVPNPAISRALDRLEELRIVRQKADLLNRRNIFIQRTAAGRELMDDFYSLVTEAGKHLR